MDSVIDFYTRTYDSMENLLHFAETKNAAMIGFNGSVIFGVLSVLKNFEKLMLKRWTTALFLGIVLTQLASMIIAFYSMIPRSNLDQTPHQPLPKHPNLTFFRHIAELTPQQFHELTKSKYGLQPDSEELAKDYAFDIVQLAVITKIKLDLFNLAIQLNAVSFALAFIWFLGYGVRLFIQAFTKRLPVSE